jgi:two-component system, NarL family, response regulator DevR
MLTGGIHVFLLAENRLLREALTKILNKKNDIRVVGAAAFSSLAIEQIVTAGPDVLLSDSAVHALSELQVIPEVIKAIPNLKVVMIGMEADKKTFLHAVRQGVIGYVLKDASAMEVLAAVRSVANDEAVCPPGLCRSLFERVASESALTPSLRIKHGLGLSRREQQLVHMIGHGLTNKEIAVQLNLSEQTVKNHIHHMLRKLGASDRLAVVELCRQHGLVA